MVVRVHEPRHDDPTARVDPRAWGEARTGGGRRFDRDDAIGGDRDGAVGDDPVFRVEREDETAVDEQVAGFGSVRHRVAA